MWSPAYTSGGAQARKRATYTIDNDAGTDALQERANAVYDKLLHALT
jgi:hypothetical protein